MPIISATIDSILVSHTARGRPPPALHSSRLYSGRKKSEPRGIRAGAAHARVAGARGEILWQLFLRD
jgi:hypothetical protein